MEIIKKTVNLDSFVMVKREIKDTFKMLRLYKKNSCQIVSNTKQIEGMIFKLKDHITWGEISKETLELLLKERGKVCFSRYMTVSEPTPRADVAMV